MRNFSFAGSVLLVFLALVLLVSPLNATLTSQAADPTLTPGMPMPPITPPPTGTPGVPPPSPTPTPSGPPYLQLPLSADWQKTADSPEAKVKATIELPGAAFEIAWSPLSKMGNTFIAETRIWGVGDNPPQSSSYTHEYSLGDVPTGQYLFVLRDWGKIIGAEIIGFVSTTAGTPTPAPSPTPRPTVTPPAPPGTPIPPLVVAMGHLVKLPLPVATAVTTTVVPPYGTHGLMKDGQLVAALRSEKVNLDSYVGQDVMVWGNPVPTLTAGPTGIAAWPPLIDVLGIAVTPPMPTPFPRPSVTPMPWPSATPAPRPSVTPTPRPSATPTPRPSVTPTPVPSPRPTPTPRGAAVYVGSATLPVGRSARLPVIVRNVTSPAGLAAYDFRVSYNPAVIRVDDVTGGTAPFDSIAAKNIDNSAGQVAFNAFHSSIPGPTGDIIVAYLAVTAAATTLSTTPVNVTVVSLVDTAGATVSAVSLRSWVTVLPSTSEAVVRLVPGIGSDGRAVINVIVDRLRNASTNADVAPPGAIQRFSGQANYDPDRISVLAIRGMGAFASPSTDIQNGAGGATFGGSQTAGAASAGSLMLAQILPRINGSSANSNLISVSLDALEDGSGNIAYDAPALRLKRGDAKPDGTINITDALFIAQFLAGARAAGDGDNEVNVVNAASVRPDGDGGDKLDIVDALFIAQRLVGLRDDSFNPVQ